LIMGDFIALCAVVIAGLSPLLRRFYIDRFWIHGRGTVIRLDGVINENSEAVAWVWMPIVEYQAAGQRFSSRVFLRWPGVSAKSEYSVGDRVDILYDPRNPSRVMLDNWAGHIFSTILISGWLGIIIADRLPNAR